MGAVFGAVVVEGMDERGVVDEGAGGFRRKVCRSDSNGTVDSSSSKGDGSATELGVIVVVFGGNSGEMWPLVGPGVEGGGE